MLFMPTSDANGDLATAGTRSGLTTLVHRWVSADGWPLALHDYGHSGVLFGRRAADEVFALVGDWLDQ